MTAKQQLKRTRRLAYLAKRAYHQHHEGAVALRDLHPDYVLASMKSFRASLAAAKLRERRL